MVKKSKENVEIIAQKIFLELGHLNVHDLFKKKIFEIIYLLNSKSNYKLLFRQIFKKILKDIYDQ